MQMTDSDGFRKFFDYALKIFVILGTFFYLPTPQGFRTEMQIMEWGYLSQELFFRYGVVFLFCCSLLVKPIRKMNTKGLGILLIYLLVSSLLISYGVSARRAILNVFIGIVFYKIIVEYFDFRQIKSFMAWFFWLLVANLIICQLQLLRLDPIFARLDEPLGIVEPVGFMRLRASLGLLASVIAPASILLSPWALIVSLPLLYYSKASAAALAFLVGVGAVLWFKIPRRLFVLAGIGLLIAGSVYLWTIDRPDKTSSFSRFEVWGVAASYTLKVSPFFGNGAGSFREFEPHTDQKTSDEKLRWIWVHNEFIQAFFEFGLVGLVIIVLFLKNRIKEFLVFKTDFISQCLFGSFLAVLVISFFHFPWHVGKLAGLCVFFLAVFHARTTELRSLYEE